MCVCGDSGEKWICSIIMLRKSTDSKLLLSQGRKNGVNKLTKEKESSIRQRHPNAKTKLIQPQLQQQLKAIFNR